SVPATPASPLPLSTSTETRERARKGAACSFETRPAAATGRVRSRPVFAWWAPNTWAPATASSTVSSASAIAAPTRAATRHGKGRPKGWTCSTDRHGSPKLRLLLLRSPYRARRVRELRGSRRLGQVHAGRAAALGPRRRGPGRRADARAGRHRARRGGARAGPQRTGHGRVGGSDARRRVAGGARRRGDPTGTRSRRGRRLRPLHRLVARLPGDRARARGRRGAAAHSRRDVRSAPGRDLSAPPRSWSCHGPPRRSRPARAGGIGAPGKGRRRLPKARRALPGENRHDRRGWITRGDREGGA